MTTRHHGSWPAGRWASSLAVWALGASALCYRPDGTTADMSHATVCDKTADFSHCCVDSDECTTNGLCKAPGDGDINWYWRESCTDPSWGSANCPRFCHDSGTGADAAGNDWLVFACTSTTYCCNYNTSIPSRGDFRACCDDPDRVVNLGPAVYLAGARVTTSRQSPGPTLSSSSTSPSASTSTLVSATSTAGGGSGAAGTTGQPSASAAGQAGDDNTSTSGDDSDEGLSQGAKIGIGVGVPAGVLALVAVGFLAWRAGKKRAGTAPTDAQAGPDGYTHPAPAPAPYGAPYAPYAPSTATSGYTGEKASYHWQPGGAGGSLHQQSPVELMSTSPVELPGHSNPIEMTGGTGRRPHR